MSGSVRAMGGYLDEVIVIKSSLCCSTSRSAVHCSAER
jgi:hypothetical protein